MYSLSEFAKFLKAHIKKRGGIENLDTTTLIKHIEKFCEEEGKRIEEEENRAVEEELRLEKQLAEIANE